MGGGWRPHAQSAGGCHSQEDSRKGKRKPAWPRDHLFRRLSPEFRLQVRQAERGGGQLAAASAANLLPAPIRPALACSPEIDPAAHQRNTETRRTCDAALRTRLRENTGDNGSGGRGEVGLNIPRLSRLPAVAQGSRQALDGPQLRVFPPKPRPSNSRWMQQDVIGEMGSAGASAGFKPGCTPRTSGSGGGGGRRAAAAGPGVHHLMKSIPVGRRYYRYAGCQVCWMSGRGRGNPATCRQAGIAVAAVSGGRCAQLGAWI